MVILFDVITSDAKGRSYTIYKVHKDEYLSWNLKDDNLLIKLYGYNGLKYRIEIKIQKGEKYYERCEKEMTELYKKINSVYEPSEAKLDSYITFKP